MRQQSLSRSRFGKNIAVSPNILLHDRTVPDSTRPIASAVSPVRSTKGLFGEVLFLGLETSEGISVNSSL